MKKVISECKLYLINFFGSVAVIVIFSFLFGDAIAGFDHILLGTILLLSALAIGSAFLIIGHIIVYFREKRKEDSSDGNF